MDPSRSHSQAPQLPGADAVPLAGVGGSGGLPTGSGDGQGRRETVRAALAVVGLVVVSVALFAVVQTAALEAKRAYGDDALLPAWLIGSGIAGSLTLGWSWRMMQRNFRREEERLARSMLTDATVTAIKATGTPGKDGYSERPTFRFAAPGRGTIEHRSEFPELGLTVGESVAVRFDPTEPTWVALDAHDYAAARRTAKWFGLVCAAAGAVSVLVGIVLFSRI